MSDVFSAEKRSWVMGKVRGKNTSAELKVRSLAHHLGFRFRLNRTDLPGKPDIVFPSRKKAIFVHGCFWHGHDCLRGNRCPKTNTEYWTEKIRKNIERDNKSQTDLKTLGWNVLVVWECELINLNEVAIKLNKFLSDTNS